VELLRIIKVEKELKSVEREGVLNIQPLDVRSLSHSSSSSECEEGKVYNEKIQFAQIIIQNIDTTGTSVVEFLHRRK
jgi:hypothetical protein